MVSFPSQIAERGRTATGQHSANVAAGRQRSTSDPPRTPFIARSGNGS